MSDVFPRVSDEEARVVGAMVEKAMTTPDNYPMSLNAVVVACNQVSNRDPVVDYADSLVERTLRGLADRGLAKMVHRPGDRVVKYRHALGAALADADGVPADDKRLALLGVLLLRGAQTPGELRQRTARYVEFESLPEIEITLEGMRTAGLIARLERRPGQKESRYVELLSPRAAGEAADAAAEAATPVAAEPQGPQPDDLAAMRAEIAELRRRFETLLGQLGVDDI